MGWMTSRDGRMENSLPLSRGGGVTPSYDAYMFIHDLFIGGLFTFLKIL